MSTEILLAIVPWLAVLACPLMMLVMMRMMPGGSCHKKPAGEEGNEEIRRLQARVAELESRTETTEVGR